MRLSNKKISIFIIILVSIHFIFSDTTSIEKKQSLSSLYFDFGGQSFLGSVNYDRKIYRNIISAHIGIGALIPFSPYYTIPFGFNYLFTIGDDKYIESGIGITPWLNMNDKIRKLWKNDNKIYPNIWYGFRYQKSKSYFIKGGGAIYPKRIDKYVIIPSFSIGTSF